MKTETAQCAAMIKAELKKLGIKCSVKSKLYAGGDSVNVKVYDIPGKQLQDIESLLGKYQEGSFNGYEDIYEYDNKQDVPQCKYLFLNCERSDEFIQKYLDKINAEFHVNGTLEQYKNGTLPSVFCNGSAWDMTYMRELRKVW